MTTLYDRQAEIDVLNVEIQPLRDTLVALEASIEELEIGVYALENRQDIEK